MEEVLEKRNMPHSEPRPGFTNNGIESVTDDDPSNQTVEGLCQGCGKVSDLKCSCCGSTSVLASEGEQKAKDVTKLRQVILMAQSAKNSKYFLGCFLIAIGDPAAMGERMREFAAHWHVSRQAVSKTSNLIRIYLGLPPSQYMKSEESRQSFRKSNRRPQKIK